MTPNLRPYLLLLPALVLGACGPTKHRLVSPAAYPTAGDRPCVHSVDLDGWQPGHRTQHQCAAWSDRTEFDIIDTEWTYFPHFLIGSTGRSGRACPECWLEVERPPREQPEGPWTMRLHVPPQDAVIATYTGGYASTAFQGDGALSLVRDDACTRYCLDFFVAEGELADAIVMQGEWSRGFLGQEEAFHAEWTLADGGSYVGTALYDPVKGLVPHGQGSRRSADGSTYLGSLQNGARHGEGETHHVDGSVYVGQYASDKPHGEGILTEANGARYEGTFVDGQRQGDGTQHHPDGSHYEGAWSQDMRHGVGVFTDAYGITWSGVWEDGVLAGGEAKVAWPDGQVYQGLIDGRAPHGHGVMEWASGERYSGSWKRGRMAGLGQLRWADGNTYTGGWREGRPSGCGLHQYPDGSVFVGTWTGGAPTVASCREPVLAFTSQDLEALGDTDLEESALTATHRAQQRTRASREAASAQLATLREHYVPDFPPPPQVEGAELPDSAPERRTVRVGFAWPGDHHQRMVHPSCLDEGALEVTVDDAPADFRLGGVVDAEIAIALEPGSTSMVCATMVSGCGRGRGCVATDVPVDPVVPEQGGLPPLRLRILLEHFPEITESGEPEAPPASEDSLPPDTTAVEPDP